MQVILDFTPQLSAIPFCGWKGMISSNPCTGNQPIFIQVWLDRMPGSPTFNDYVLNISPLGYVNGYTVGTTVVMDVVDCTAGTMFTITFPPLNYCGGSILIDLGPTPCIPCGSGSSSSASLSPSGSLSPSASQSSSSGVVTGCCANPLPLTVHITLTNVSGLTSCDCMAGSFPMTFSPSVVTPFGGVTGAWVSGILTLCGNSVQFWFYCVPGAPHQPPTFALEGTCAGADIFIGSPIPDNLGFTCSPLSVGFSHGTFCGTCGSTVQFNVTQ